jgi:predicted chitinase
MKGISKIKGPVRPQIGQDSFYEVAEYYPGTIIPNSSNIKWKIFKKRNGKWYEAKGNEKTGAKVSFNFSPESYANEILVEAYVTWPEMKTPPGLVVIPVLGPRKIVNTQILDANGAKITQPPKYGQSIILRATTQNMPGEKLKLSLWERDTVSDTGHDPKENVELWPAGTGETGKTEKIEKNGVVEKKILLTHAMRTKANESSFELFEHEYYLLVEARGIRTISRTTQVSDQEIITTNSPPPSETPSILEQIAVKIKNVLGLDELMGDDSNKTSVIDGSDEEEEGKCSNCDKDITLDEIKKICVDSNGRCSIGDLTMITAALPYLNKYRKKVGINTCIRKAHFLAQISHESKFYSLQEIFNWHWERIIGVFSSYFNQFQTREAKETEARRLGRANRAPSPGLTLDQQKTFANAIYGSTHPLGALHTNPDDGWRYSGKGFKQITWKDNYQNLQEYFNRNMKIDGEADVVWVDGDNPYKLKNNAKDAITSALAFWGKKGINGVATKISYESVTSVTKKINAALDGLDERKRYFKKAVEVLKTDECVPKEDLTLVSEKGTVVVISGVLFKLGAELDSARRQWPVYKTSVYQNMSLETYKTKSNNNQLPTPNYITYLSRDAHMGPTNTLRSNKRYGSSNEAPPGTYYLNKGISTQKYHIFLADTQGVGQSGISSGPDGWRDGIAIHGGWPAGAIGCLTTHTSNYGNKSREEPINPLVQELIDNIPDFDNNTDDKPVRFIIEERVATKNGRIWKGESI